MKKRSLIAMLMIAAVLFAGCSAAEPAADPAPEAAPEAAPAEEAVPAEPEFEYAVPTNDIGLKNATVEELANLVSAGESFYLYVAGTAAYDYEALKTGFGNLLKDYECPVDIYYTDESILSETELAELKAAGVANAESADTLSGLYAFEGGALKNSRFDFVPSEENKNIASKVVNFIFESDLFQNSHGWEMVTYEELQQKRDSGEKFIVYIGRDTCPYCMPFAKCVVSALESRPANVPVYYFYTQSFKTAINRAEEGAQEAWDSVKADIGFEFTPSFILFEGGKQAAFFEGGLGSEYFEMSDDEKMDERDIVAAELKRWLTDNELA